MMFFSIDTTQSQKNGLLTIRLTTGTTPLTLDERTLSTACKDPLVKILVDEEKKLAPTKKFFDFFRIRPGIAPSLLQKLAATGNLSIDTKKAIIDFFSKISLEVDAIADGQEVLVIGTLLHQGHKLPFSHFDSFIRSNPPIALKAPFLYFFDDSVDWNDISILQKESLEKEEYLAWKKETSVSCTIAPEAVSAPKPLLVLHDARAVFCTAFVVQDGKKLPCTDPLLQKELTACGYQYKPIGTTTHFCPHDKASKALLMLYEKGWTIQDLQARTLHPLGDCTLSHEVHDDVIELTGRIAAEGHVGTVQDYIKALQQGNCIVSLGADAIGLMSDIFQSALAQEVEFISDRPILKKQLIGLVDEQPLRQSSQQVATTLSTRFSGTLRPYQEEGVSWMRALAHQGFGGILADDMGLGKTVQAISFLTHLPEDALHLIVAPTSLLVNWQREISCFFPGCTVACHHGPTRDVTSWPQTGIILTSYGTLRQDIDWFAQQLFTACILDEAQAIKNESSDTAKAVYRLKASFTLSMTGTPIENNPLELFSQFQAVMPHLLLKEEVSATTDPFMVQRIKKKIRPFILRRKKEEVAKDLPAMIEQTIFVEMADEELGQYRHMAEVLKKGLVSKFSLDGAAKHRMEILEAILRLRQLASHPRLIEQLASHGILASAKFDLVLADIDTLVQEGKKIILFTQFAQLIPLFQQEMRTRNYDSLVLDGQTKDRQGVVDQFQNGKQQLLFMTMKAGGVGLNLTAADAILLYDPWWNEAQEAQGIGRAHRIGRQGTVLVKRYIVKNSIEEKIRTLQQAKKKTEQLFLDDIGTTTEAEGLEQLLF